MSAARWTALAEFYLNRAVEEPVEEAEHKWELIQVVGATATNEGITQAVDLTHAAESTITAQVDNAINRAQSELDAFVNREIIHLSGEIVTDVIRYGAIGGDLKNQVEDLLNKAEAGWDTLDEDVRERVNDFVDHAEEMGFTTKTGILDRLEHDLGIGASRVIDAGTEHLARAVGSAITGSVGDLLEKSIIGDPGQGVKTGERMAALAPEVVKKGSPSIRKNLETAERAVLEELDANVQKLIDDLKEKHSPIGPGASATAAGVIGAGSVAGFVALAAAGSAIETASLGQLEIPGQFFLQIGGMYGLAKMAGSVINVPYHWGVEVGHNYFWADQFRPMIPSMTDLVRFEVREVWREEFRIEQLEETPSSDFKRWAGFQGFSGDHADSYWAAHWDLPGISQAYEMFHRLRPGRDEAGLTFTREDLLKLMRRRDMLKRYRDPLIAIAYEVPTRREIRMMVDAGTLSRDDAEQVYLDRGVDPRFAGALADFAWARAQRDPYRARMISAAIDLFKEGIWPEAVFKARLKEEDVPESMIEEATELAAIEYERDEWRDFITLEREKFRKKKTTPGQFLGALTAKGMVPDRAKLLVDREAVRRGLEVA